VLKLPAKTPVLVERRIIADQDEKPVKYTTTIYHGKRYVIDAVFTLAP
jgi:DNA-binding GntR family transcriptional regulator